MHEHMVESDFDAEIQHFGSSFPAWEKDEEGNEWNKESDSQLKSDPKTSTLFEGWINKFNYVPFWVWKGKYYKYWKISFQSTFSI